MRRAYKVALQLRLSSACSSSVAGPSRSIVDQQKRRSTVVIAMSEQDEKLIQRGEFYGVAATSGVYSVKTPDNEDALSRMQERLTRNYRVNPENVMRDLVLRLENGDESLIAQLQREPERWIPMSIRFCGRALSSIQIESRRAIASRLWKQIEKRDLPISIESINAFLRVKLENDEKWDAWETLKEIEEKRVLVPDQETFHLLLAKISLSGDASECSKLQSYEMARRGHSPSDAISHSHLVYASAVRGHDHKADSMIQQASTKFGPEGEVLSLGAACVAAAAMGRIDRLREVLRRSVDDKLKLRLPIESVFEIIWKLSEERGDNVTNHEAVIEEILSRTSHPTGFFRFLFREVERHISASHFRTSMLLLAETMRVQGALKSQERTPHEQLVGKMCRAMISSRIDQGLMMDMANRMETRVHIRSHLIHNELMLAALTLKDFDEEERFTAFSSLLPIVDPNRERPHLILPLLAANSNVEERLKLIFRASSLGYSNLEKLDIKLMANYIFQPMYNRHSYFARKRQERGTVMDKMTLILHSFGVPKESVWQMMNGWWKMRKEERISLESMRPFADEIQTWLRSEYASIFDRAKEDAPTLPLNKTRLDAAIEEGDSSTVISLLSTHGWPANDIDLSETAPRILELLLKNESSVDIMKWLYALSREAACRQEREEEVMKSPLDSSHLLRILRHRLAETRAPKKALVEMAYELKRLFPNAVYNQDSFLDTIPETNRLVTACFMFKEGQERQTVAAVDNIIELLRTLIKLEIVYLTVHEVVTPYCVNRVLQRFGWESAVKLWQRFQSSLSLGNGLVILLSHAHRPYNDNVKENVQFLLHRAQSCLSPSRIHSIYAAVLVNTGTAFRLGRREDEALEYFKKYGSEMSPYDCAFAYRLINGCKYPQTEQYYVRTFPSLCLAYTPLAEKKEAGFGKNMLHSALAFCEAKRSGPLIVEMCELFAKYGIEADEKEKGRVESAMARHQQMIDRWIFSPEGLIQAKADDEFIKEDEWRKFVKAKEPVEESTVTLG